MTITNEDRIEIFRTCKDVLDIAYNESVHSFRLYKYSYAFNDEKNNKFKEMLDEKAKRINKISFALQYMTEFLQQFEPDHNPFDI